MDESRLAAAEQFLTEWLADERVPGAGFAVVADGETVHAAGYGARELATNTPATAETLYGVGSVTKSVTALAVLQQVERTGLALDDPVSEYLTVYDDLDQPPTVRELLTHTSGFPSDGTSVALLARLTGVDGVEVPLSSPTDLDRHVAGAVTDRVDDGRCRYYNTGYTVLGRLVATLDRRAFPTYVAEELLDPLGMERAVVSPTALDDHADTAAVYRPGTREPTQFPVKGVGAAGGLVASAQDLAAYLQFQTTGDGVVVSDDHREAAHDGHTSWQTYRDGTERRYGYGWMRRPFDGDSLIEHGGSLAVSSAYVGFLANDGLGVALACNDSPEAHPQFVGPALLAIPRGGAATDTRFYRLREQADRVAGSYESYRGIQTVTVDRDGSRLAVTVDNALEESSFEAFPADRETVDGPESSNETGDRGESRHETADGAEYRYETVGVDGVRHPLRFVETDGGIDLFYQRWRLHAV